MASSLCENGDGRSPVLGDAVMDCRRGSLMEVDVIVEVESSRLRRTRDEVGARAKTGMWVSSRGCISALSVKVLRTPPSVRNGHYMHPYDGFGC